MAGFTIRYGAGNKKKQLQAAYGEIKKPAVRLPLRYVSAASGLVRGGYSRIKWPHDAAYQFGYTSTSDSHSFAYPAQTRVKSFCLTYCFRVGLSWGRRYRFCYGQGYGNLYVEDTVKPFMPPYRKSLCERGVIALPIILRQVTAATEVLMPVLLRELGQLIKTIDLAFLIRELGAAAKTVELPFLVRELDQAVQTRDFSFIIRELAPETAQSQAFSFLIRELANDDTMTAHSFSLLIRELAKDDTMVAQEFSLLIREIAAAQQTWDFSLLIREIATAESTVDFSLLIREIAEAERTQDFSFLIREIAAAEKTLDFSFLIREIASAIKTQDFSFIIREIGGAEGTLDFSFIIREIADAVQTQDFSFIVRELAKAERTQEFSFIIREIAEAAKTQDFSFIIREIAEAAETPAFSFIVRELAKMAEDQAFALINRDGKIAPEELLAALIMQEIAEASRPQLALPPEQDGIIEETEQHVDRVIEKDGLLEDDRIDGVKLPKESSVDTACQLDSGEKETVAPQEVKLIKALTEILAKHDDLQLFKLLDEGATQKDTPLSMWKERSVEVDSASILEQEPEGDINHPPMLEPENEGASDSDVTMDSIKEAAAHHQQLLEADKAIHLEEAVAGEAPKEGEYTADVNLDKGSKETAAPAESERGEKLAKPWLLDDHETPLNKLNKEAQAGIEMYGFEKQPKVLQTETIDLLLKKLAKEMLIDQPEQRLFTAKEGVAEKSADPLMRKEHEIMQEADSQQGRKQGKDADTEDNEVTFKDKAAKPGKAARHEQQTCKKRRIFDALIEAAEQLPRLKPRQHDSLIETPETENRLHREPEGLTESLPDAGATEHQGDALTALLLAYPELAPIMTAMQVYSDEKQAIAENDLLATRPWAEAAAEQVDRKLNLYQRFWVIGQSDYKDWLILPPHDFDYEAEPITFDVPERVDYNQCVYPNEYYRRIDRHPILFGKDVGREEIGVSVGIMIDLINIYVLMWCKFTAAFWGWTGVQAVVGMTDAIYEYLTLETTMQKRQDKGVTEEYDRAFQWLRWHAEAVALKAREDQNLRGNYYVEVLLEQLIQYMIDHHFDTMSIFRDINKMDEWRMAFERTKEKDIKWVIDKVKGIRHKLLEAKEYKED